MKINTKRLISTLTAVMMLMTMLPGFALGESDKKYTETLQPKAGPWWRTKAVRP